MVRELVFHVGTPKTASSAIQVFLARNAGALLRSSVEYLDIGEIALGAAGKISSGNGAYLSRCLFPAGAYARIEDGARYVEEFLAAVRDSEAALGIVSSELFVDADRASLAALVARLREMGVLARCFYFIRSQVQCLSSAYVQQVKRHACTELPAEYVARAYRHIPFLKHHTFYSGMSDVFGSTNVVCRVYDIAVAAGARGVLAAMLAALNIGLDGLDLHVDGVNTSLAPRDIAILLTLNRLRPRMRFSDLVVENASLAGSAMAGDVHNFLPSALVQEIESYFLDENARMAREYFHRPDLFPRRPLDGPPASISLDDLSAGDLVGFFGGLLVRYDERLAALEDRLALRAR